MHLHQQAAHISISKYKLAYECKCIARIEPLPIETIHKYDPHDLESVNLSLNYTQSCEG